jgi:hypothetical protein
MPPPVREYRQGRLSPEQERAFEERLLREPELVEALELDEAIERGLRAHKPARRAWQPWLGAAAMLLAGVGSGFLGARWLSPPPAPMELQVAKLDLLRGAPERQWQVVRRDRRALVLLLPAMAAGRHRIVLQGPADRWERGFEAGAERAAVLVPPDVLSVADYRVLIDGSDAYRLGLRVTTGNP